jgi:serine/threonine protein kinase
MGVVWLARDERLGESVALKLLPPEIRSDPVALDDLRRETLKSRRLTHPNIIRIHDLFEADSEAAFISMEYVDGPNLSDLRLQQPARLFTWGYLKPLARQLCDALESAHNEKVVHRDLKPGNMMLDSRGRLKLADFGIAATVSDSVSRTSLRQMTSGTPTFMSPQQMEGQMPRVSDDIYALGATLYELLTSRPPFCTGDIVHQVKNVAAQPMAERLTDLELVNEIPADVAAMVMACLAKDPAQRPQSARAVAEWIGLESGTSNKTGALLPQVTSEPQAETDESEEVPNESGRETSRTGMWVAIGVVVALVSGLGWWWTVARKNRHQTTAETVVPNLAERPQLSAESIPTGQGATVSNGSRWTNSLGMVFAPVPGTTVYFSVWDTRVQDFEAFVKATGHDATPPSSFDRNDGWKQPGNSWRNPGFAQGPTHPVCGVNWGDAQAFCKWLTDKERAVGKLSSAQSYRLPKDWEWSAAVGLSEPRPGLPGSKNRKILGVYPWGTQWPPPPGSGNYAGIELKDAGEPANTELINGYRDGYAGTSPVGTFAPNRLGLYDMGGNLWQWCEDWNESERKARVLRGGSWFSADPRNLLSSSRYKRSPDVHLGHAGFRCVIAVMSSK